MELGMAFWDQECLVDPRRHRVQLVLKMNTKHQVKSNPIQRLVRGFLIADKRAPSPSLSPSTLPPDIILNHSQQIQTGPRC